MKTEKLEAMLKNKAPESTGAKRKEERGLARCGQRACHLPEDGMVFP
jgi:hypothetical protein